MFQSKFLSALPVVVSALGASLSCAASTPVTAPTSMASTTSALRGLHLEATLLSDHGAIRPGEDFQLGVDFKLEHGWHIYWKNAGDSGEAPRIRWTLPAGLVAGEIQWPTPRRIEVGPLVNYGYEDEVLLPVVFHAARDLSGTQTTVAAELRWLICREVCIPGKGRLELRLPVATPTSHGEETNASAAPLLFAAAARMRPLPLPAEWKPTAALGADAFDLSIAGVGRDPGSVVFFPAKPDLVVASAPVQHQFSAGVLKLRLKRSDQLLDPEAKELSSLDGVLVLGVPDNSRAAGSSESTARAYDVSLSLGGLGSPGSPHAAGGGGALVLTLLFAFLGGMLLNLMPCVFPVLSIKVMSIARMGGEARSRVIGMGWAYTLGILVSFWALVGVLLFLRYGGSQVGWGFQLQSPRFVLLLACVLFAFGLSLLGFFELSGSFTGWGDRLSSRGGYVGSFFTGALATLVATPCTAPFMGSAVGYALSQSSSIVFGIFTALALGLALPYLVVCYIPRVGRILPKPGRWMETFKELMAFLIFATVLWLAWVLGIQTSFGGLVVLMAAFTAIGFSVWIASRWPRARAGAFVLALGSIALAAFLLNSFGAVGNPTPLAQAVSTSGAGPDALSWEKFSPEKVREYRENGRPIFIDFTAAWCISCQVNELLVFRSAEVRRKLKELGFALLKADWTNQDEAITKTLASFGRSGVPFYVVYGKGRNAPAVTLPEVINAGIVLQELERIR